MSIGMPFIVGALASSTLIIGALLVMHTTIPRKILGLITAFGVGILLFTVSIELTAQAAGSDTSTLHGLTIGGLIAGSVAFYLLNMLVEKIGSGRGRHSTQDGSPKAVAVGTVMDAIPESIILGLSMAGGAAVSLGVFVAIAVSNFPESVASTKSLLQEKWSKRAIIGLWAGTCLISGIASVIGATLFGSASTTVTILTLSFAAGGLLTMLSDAMMPQAYKDSGMLAGIATAVGFAAGLLVHSL